MNSYLIAQVIKKLISQRRFVSLLFLLTSLVILILVSYLPIKQTLAAVNTENPSVGINQFDILGQYLGVRANYGKYARAWRLQWGGSPASEVVRYGPNITGSPEGYYILRLSAQPGITNLYGASDKFPILPNTTYTASALIRKNNNVGDFRVVLLNSAGQPVAEEALTLSPSGVDASGQNWNDGWNFIKRQFTFTTPEDAAVAYLRFAIVSSPVAAVAMDVEDVSLVASDGINLAPNSSFEYGDPTDSTNLARRALDDARNINIKFMRINGGVFCSYDFDLWKRDPNYYWQIFDQLVADAAYRNIKIIPVIMWHYYAFPHMSNEPLSKLFVLNSTSNNLLKQYTRELVTRYKDNPNILFWELTNELNLATDLDLDSRGVHDLCLGTNEPVGSKNFSSDQMKAFIGDFASFVKSIDPNHSISSGFSLPRSAAQHLRLSPEWQGANWTKDSLTEVTTWLRDMHPDPVDIISTHHYPNSGTDWTAGEMVQASSAIGKTLFIGEFGDYNADETWKSDPQYAYALLDDIFKYRIPLSAVWDWETYNNVYPATFKNHALAPGRYQHVIDKIVDTNNKLADTIKPVVSITYPLNNSTIPKRTNINVRANATDNVSVTKVEFRRNGGLICTDSAVPYECLIYTDDNRNVQVIIEARAYDPSGNSQSASVMTTTK